LADLAFHFAAGGDPDKGVAYALDAANQALETSAAVDAVGHLEDALRLLPDDTPPERSASILMRLGEAATLAGQCTRATEAFRTAEERWRPSADRSAAARACYELGRVYWRLEMVANAREAFERGLDLQGPRDSAQAAEILLQLADLYATSLGRQADGLALAERAPGNREPSGQPTRAGPGMLGARQRERPCQ
jgi:tetratricopeptide (TPR) repeat protein